MKSLARSSWSTVHQINNNDGFPGFCFAVAENVGRSSTRTVCDCVAFNSIDGDTLVLHGGIADGCFGSDMEEKKR